MEKSQQGAEVLTVTLEGKLLIRQKSIVRIQRRHNKLKWGRHQQDKPRRCSAVTAAASAAIAAFTVATTVSGCEC